MNDVPPLLQRVIAARARIDRVRRASAAADSLVQLDRFHSKVREPAARLSVAASRATVLARHGRAIEWPRPLGPSVADRARQGGNAARSEPAALLDPQQFNVGQFAQMVNTLVERLGEASAERWRAYCEDRWPAIPRALLDTLRNVPALAQKVASVESRAHDLQRVTAGVPKDAREWDEAETAVAALRSALEQVTEGVGGDLPESVRLFIAAAGGAGGATLSQLNAEVVAWLRERGLEVEFCIRTRAGTRR